MIAQSRKCKTLERFASAKAYVEAYYHYDFNKPADNNRPGFIYSHNRHNEFNLNLALIKRKLQCPTTGKSCHCSRHLQECKLRS